MHSINVSDSDYDYLLLYSKAFSISVEDIIARRITILRSSTAFGLELAREITDQTPSDDLLALSNHNQLGSKESAGNLISLTI